MFELDVRRLPASRARQCASFNHSCHEEDLCTRYSATLQCIHYSKYFKPLGEDIGAYKGRLRTCMVGSKKFSCSMNVLRAFLLSSWNFAALTRSSVLHRVSMIRSNTGGF